MSFDHKQIFFSSILLSFLHFAVSYSTLNIKVFSSILQ